MGIPCCKLIRYGQCGPRSDRKPFPDRSVIVPRQACQVTGVSLFAFISELCPNRQVTGTGAGRAGSSGTGGADTAEAGTPGAPGREEAVAVAARVSFVVAEKASAENFPVALRVLPKR